MVDARNIPIVGRIIEPLLFSTEPPPANVETMRDDKQDMMTVVLQQLVFLRRHLIDHDRRESDGIESLDGQFVQYWMDDEGAKWYAKPEVERHRYDENGNLEIEYFVDLEGLEARAQAILSVVSSVRSMMIEDLTDLTEENQTPTTVDEILTAYQNREPITALDEAGLFWASGPIATWNVNPDDSITIVIKDHDEFIVIPAEQARMMQPAQ